MKTIWKFKLEPDCIIKMPAGAEILSVHEQDPDICLWALVDPEAPLQARHFIGLGTGHDVPDEPLRFIGSAHLQQKGLVFHIFEVLENTAPAS